MSGVLRTTKSGYRVSHTPASVFPTKVSDAALRFVGAKMESDPEHIQGIEALQPFFRALALAQGNGEPIHVLQYGDSHTASDDWADAMRKEFQQKFGNGGPGFTVAGHPYRGYRRFDVSGSGSSGWTTTGTMGHIGDGRNGLAGVSVTATKPGETVSLTTTCDHLELYFLKQPGGGSFSISDNGTVIDSVSTDEPFGSGVYDLPAAAGEHTYVLTTDSYAPVRLFGWVSQNDQGLTWETLGINGAQAQGILNWDQDLLKEQLQLRNPTLIVVAYGTNEAINPLWTADSYRSSLVALMRKFQDAAPNASLLLVGPPNCGRGHSFPHLRQVIEIQRDVARETGSAFWDWASHMTDSGGRNIWLQAGLSQPDFTHLTGQGYRMLGKTIADELLLEYNRLTPQPPVVPVAYTP